MLQKNISKYRTELMGISILWVYIFHSEIYFPDQAIFLLFKFIKGRGDGGVDIFIFLSGFGLMYGAKKDYILLFYKRRIFKIFPAYAIAVLLSLIVDYTFSKKVRLSDFFLKISSLWFWTGKGLFLWYISAILILYLLFPVYCKYYNNSRNKKIFSIYSITAMYIMCIIAILLKQNYYLIFLARVPVFILGIHIGYNTKNEIAKNKYLESFFFIFIALIFFIALQSLLILKIPLKIRQSLGLNYYSFIFIVYPMSVCMSQFISYIASLENIICRSLIKIIHFSGVHSLEIYLLHEYIVFPIGEKIISYFFNKFFILTVLNKGNFFEYFTFLIITISLAFLLRKITRIIQKLQHIHA